MRHVWMLIVMTALVFVASESARGGTGAGLFMLGSSAAAASDHHKPPPPPPPPPPRSKSCPCDSKGNPIDKNCGKGNDSNLP
jgi:hypothetical protein